MQSTSYESFFHKALIFLFLAVIFIPPVKMFVSPQAQWSDIEKRKLAERPPLPETLSQTESFFGSLDDYLNDHFGYRDFMISRYHKEMENGFGQTGLESKVILGKNGWYFYTAKKQIADYQGKKHLSTEKLSAWIAERNRRAEWLGTLGIEYLLMAPPGKHSIYPEFLPDEIQKLKGISRFEQLLDSTKNAPQPYLINLHQDLKEAKSNQQLYYKADTHWNMRGAYVAFQSITVALQQRFPEIEFTTAFRFGPDIQQPCSEIPGACDLARMAMQQDEVTEVVPTLVASKKCAKPRSFEHYQLTNYKQLRDRPSFVRGCPERELTAVVFRDSFFEPVHPFLSENFRYVVYLWKEYDRKNLEEIFEIFTPDVVIEARVERDFFDE